MLEQQPLSLFQILFHAHKVEFSEKGWVGIFQVNDNPQDKEESIEYGN